jgi:hypothetical protein
MIIRNAETEFRRAPTTFIFFDLHPLWAYKGNSLPFESVANNLEEKAAQSLERPDPAVHSPDLIKGPDVSPFQNSALPARHKREEKNEKSRCLEPT